MKDPIERQAAIDVLNIGAELLRRVLDDTDVVGHERQKYEWELGLIEAYIADLKDLPSAQPELSDEEKRLIKQLRSYHNGSYAKVIDKLIVSAQTEYKMDEWCHDCKEYDQERHCCPRFNRVIRETVKEIQPIRKKGKWINHRNDEGHNIADCDQCGEAMQWFDDDIKPNYCPTCGSYNGGEPE